MDALIHTFMTQMYWIDVASICTIVLFLWISIFFRSHGISQKNKTYNDELTALRTEIYNECEKNFFL